MPIGVKVGMMVELCPRTVFSPFGGDIIGDHQMRVKKRGLGSFLASQIPIFAI